MPAPPLQLPLQNRQRVGERAQDAAEARRPEAGQGFFEEVPKPGRQALAEALANWSPQTDSTHEGSVGTASSEGLKLTVKNTFIDVSSPEETRFELHRGAQSCTARLSDVRPSFGQSPSIREVAEPADGQLEALRESDDECELVPQARQQAQVCEKAKPGALSGAVLALPISKSVYGVKNTFVNVPPPQPEEPDRVTQSCMARYCAATAAATPVPPPAYAAPLQFDEALPSPPPAKSPGAVVGNQVFLEAIRSELASDSDPSPRQRGLPSMDSDFDEGHRVVVKNTFIDLAEEKPVGADRYALSCTARFSTSAQFPTFSPTAGRAGEVRQAVQFQDSQPQTPQKVAPPQVGGQPLSMGSAQHGTLGADGQPVCQPCAWFYKDSGCLNGLNCRYCHLCPQGELKSRKKLKIQRLRAQDAAAAAALEAEGEPEPQQQPQQPQQQQQPQLLVPPLPGGAARPLASGPVAAAAPMPLMPRLVAVPSTAMAPPMPMGMPGMQVVHGVPVQGAVPGHHLPMPAAPGGCISLSALLPSPA